MSAVTATIRELRTDFRSVKRKIEQHGEVVITDHGEPAYSLKPLTRKRKLRPPLPNYHQHLVQQRTDPMSNEQTKQFWEEERGGR